MHLTATAPDRVWIGDSFSIGVDLRNELAIPVLISVDVVSTSDVCSVVSSSSSGASAVRQREFLLEANGTDESAALLGGQGPFGGSRLDLSHAVADVLGGSERDPSTMGLLNGDTVSISSLLHAAAVTGYCYVSILTSVTLIGSLSVQLGQFPLPRILQEAPPSSADLGFMEVTAGGACGTTTILPGQPAATLPVAAGSVEVTATLRWTEECPDTTNHAILKISHLVDESWVPLPDAGAKLADVGEDTAHGKLDLSAGTHKFLVEATVLSAMFDWDCLLALVASGFAILVAPFLLPAALSTAVVVAALFGVVATGFLTVLGACDTEVLARETFEVTLEAVNVPVVDTSVASQAINPFIPPPLVESVSALSEELQGAELSLP